MRPEKKYLVDEVGSHLDKSSYVFLANYDRITVAETAALRGSLLEHQAEFHVVKNSVLDLAARERQMPELKAFLDGPTAIIVGGDNPPGVAKVLKKFFKEKEKVEVKVGVLENSTLTPGQVDALSELPGKDALRAQLLGTLMQPATLLVRLLSTPGVQLATVLERHREQLAEA